MLRQRQQLAAGPVALTDSAPATDAGDDVWKHFQQQQMHDAVYVVQSYGAILLVLWVAFVTDAICHLFKDCNPSMRADGEDHTVFLVCLFIVCTCSIGLIGLRFSKGYGWNLLRFFRFYYHDLVGNWYYCIAHNCLFLNLTMLAFSLHIFLLPIGLARHGAFFAIYFIYGNFAMAHCYLPIRWHLAFVSFPLMLSWIAWHWAGGLHASVWGIFWPAAEVLGFRVFEAREWARYQAQFQAKDALALSKAFRHALQSMLSSVFDASCECDSEGKILAASPHFQQLFGEQVLNSNLSALAASAEEALRIAALVEQTLQHGGARASPCAKIETSLCCQEANDLRMTLHCVAFSVEADLASRSRILIGCQRAQLTEAVKLPDAVDLSQTIPSTFSPSILFESLPDGPRPPERQAGDFDVETKSESTFTLTLTHSSGMQECVVSGQTISAATQTEPELHTEGFTPIVLTELSARSIGTQTLYKHHLPPAPLVEAQVRRLHRKSGRAPVILTTRKRVLSSFAETPKQTLDFMIYCLMRQINPRGKGCCFYHIVLQVLCNRLLEMSAAECHLSVRPFDDWQCKFCFALNEIEDNQEKHGDDPDLEDIACIACGMEKGASVLAHRIRGDTSSTAADDEA